MGLVDFVYLGRQEQMLVEDYLRTVRIHSGDLELAAYTLADTEEYRDFMMSLRLWNDLDKPYVFPWFHAFGQDPKGEAEKSVARIAQSVEDLSAERWDLPLLVRYRGKIVGTQDIRALNFADAKAISTGSLLDLRYQGRGLGKQMRRMLLIFAFDYLGAQQAISGAHPENHASCGVSRACGYQPIDGDFPPLAEEMLTGWQYFCVTPETFIRAGLTITLTGTQIELPPSL